MVLITIKSGNDPQFLFDVPAKEGGQPIILIRASWTDKKCSDRIVNVRLYGTVDVFTLYRLK